MKISSRDLTHFAPYGMSYYGFSEPKANPFKSGPIIEPAGGTLFFNDRTKRPDFDALLRILEVPAERKDYSLIRVESDAPEEDGYLTQVRLVSKFALRHFFGEISEEGYEKFTNQELSASDTLWNFMESEKERWSGNLLGVFGGDDDAYEELSFGFMVENDYYHIHRLWSRAWLVTK